MFKRLGIPQKLIQQTDISRTTDKHAREIGFQFKGDCAGIVFRYFNLAGKLSNARLRRDHPELDNIGRPKNKYLSLANIPRLLYLPPGAAKLLQSKNTRVVVVESEKAALAIMAAAKRLRKPWLALAIGGCYGWLGRRGLPEGKAGKEETSSPTVPLSDLALLRDLDVTICFDRNVTTNSNVRHGEKGLATIWPESLVHDQSVLPGFRKKRTSMDRMIIWQRQATMPS